MNSLLLMKTTLPWYSSLQPLPSYIHGTIHPIYPWLYANAMVFNFPDKLLTIPALFLPPHSMLNFGRNMLINYHWILFREEKCHVERFKLSDFTFHFISSSIQIMDFSSEEVSLNSTRTQSCMKNSQPASAASFAKTFKFNI